MERSETSPVAGPPPGTYSANGWVLIRWGLFVLIFGATGVFLFSLCTLCQNWVLYLLAIMYPGVAGLLLTVIAFGLSVETLISIGVRVEVRPDGLVWHRFGTIFIPWERVRLISTNLLTEPPSDPLCQLLFWCCGAHFMISTSIHLDDGRRFTMTTSIPQLAELTRIIEEETSRRLLPAALKDYLAGKDLDFGALRVSIKGVQLGIHTRPWCEVTSISFDPTGRLRIECQSVEWPNAIVISPAKAWNLALLPRLYAEVRRATDGDRPLGDEQAASEAQGAAT